MEELAGNLQQPLTFLIYSSAIMAIIVTGFVIKLIVDLSGFVNSAESLLTAIQQEISPTLKEINSALKSLNNIASGTENKFNAVSQSVDKGFDVLSKSTKKAVEKGKDITLYIKNGIKAGLKCYFNSSKS